MNKKYKRIIIIIYELFRYFKIKNIYWLIYYKRQIVKEITQ